MPIIAKLSDMIEEELCDAEKYIECAMDLKAENQSLADAFCKISIEEIGHVNILHAQVVSLIEAYRKEHGTQPEKMIGIYEYLHKKHSKKANEIKVMQTLYKG